MALNNTAKMGDKNISLKNFNDLIICTLCGGYLIDATTLIDCLHVFCRGCILKYFENCKAACPTCNTVYKKKMQSAYFRSDVQLQSLIYKMVPGLYTKELQRRDDFYRSTGVRASSSCSDDSVLERERDSIMEVESHDNNPAVNNVSVSGGNKNHFFGPDDSISLSLEYYQVHLDQIANNNKKNDLVVIKDNIVKTEMKKEEINVVKDNNNTNTSGDNKCEQQCSNSNNKVNGLLLPAPRNVMATGEGGGDDDGDVKIECLVDDDHKSVGNNSDRTGDKRFLQCPGAVTTKHLQKFIRMKYALTANHRVDIIYQGEVLPPNFNLMDVAYTFKWKRTKPMRFFYRIFTPMKVHPIKIVNTTLSTGGKQLQIVPIKPNSSDKIETTTTTAKFDDELSSKDRGESTTTDELTTKEKLLANLQLQSTNKNNNKVQNNNENKNRTSNNSKFLVPEKASVKVATTIQTPINNNSKQHQDCIFEYVEPDKEEIKRFAENRDREWALQKRLDENSRTGAVSAASSSSLATASGANGNNNDGEYHHISKKRKKNKHSKNDSTYKKRKLHAEITNKEEDLKLKVKLTHNNGHKHKHHKSSSSSSSASSSSSIPKQQQTNDKKTNHHHHHHHHNKEQLAVAASTVVANTTPEATTTTISVASSPSSSSTSSSSGNELSSKEKLLQMRQVRHKQMLQVTSEVTSDSVKKSDEKDVFVDDKLRKIKPGNNDLSSNSLTKKAININRKSEDVAAKLLMVSYKNNSNIGDNITTTTNSTCSTITTTVPPSSNNNSSDTIRETKEIVTSNKSSSTSGSGVSTAKKLRSDFSIKPPPPPPVVATPPPMPPPQSSSTNKEWASRVPTVQIERNEQTEQQAKKTFLKTFQSYSEKYHQKNSEKVQQQTKLMPLPGSSTGSEIQGATTTSTVRSNSNNRQQQTLTSQLLERKIANLQQQCTIEAKTAVVRHSNNNNNRLEKKVTLLNDKNKLISPQYPPGFTVSKIESGVKRKLSGNGGAVSVGSGTNGKSEVDDKRPSLEITVINPLLASSGGGKPSPSACGDLTMKLGGAKRPPPATIPLERIKKSISLKSGISIIPKLPDRCDNIGALDLSKPNKLAIPHQTKSNNNTTITTINSNNKNCGGKIVVGKELASLGNKGLTTLNGFGMKSLKNLPKSPISTSVGGTEKNIQLSNLQMLSKVATEHPNLNKAQQNLAVTTMSSSKPKMPNLQTLKIPSVVQQQQPHASTTTLKSPPNLAKIPKLNEINKTQFRMINPQMRNNVRPNQNQNIRNIPNVSLLMRQQNQNRLNSISQQQQQLQKVRSVTPNNNSVSALANTAPVTDSVSKDSGNSSSSSITGAVKEVVTPVVVPEAAAENNASTTTTTVTDSKTISVVGGSAGATASSVVETTKAVSV